MHLSHTTLKVKTDLDGRGHHATRGNVLNRTNPIPQGPGHHSFRI